MIWRYLSFLFTGPQPAADRKRLLRFVFRGGILYISDEYGTSTPLAYSGANSPSWFRSWIEKQQVPEEARLQGGLS